MSRDLFQRTRDVLSNPGTVAEATAGTRRSATPVIDSIRKAALTVGALVSLAACQAPGYAGPGYQGAGQYPQGGEVLSTGGIVGGLGGAALGGYAGSQFGRGGGKVAATTAGVLLGAVLGNRVGSMVGYPSQPEQQGAYFQGGQQQMFQQGGYPPPPVGFVQPRQGLSYEQQNLRRQLISAPVGSNIQYRDPQTGYVENYQIVREGIDGNGQACRQFHADVISNGQPTSGFGMICRDRYGNMRLSSADVSADSHEFAEITESMPGFEAPEAPAASRLA